MAKIHEILYYMLQCRNCHIYLYLYIGVYVLVRTNYINPETYASCTSHIYEILKWHKGGVWGAGKGKEAGFI